MEVFIDKEFLFQVFRKHQADTEDEVFREVISFFSTLVKVKIFINASQYELVTHPVLRKLTNMGINFPIALPNLVDEIDSCASMGNSSFKLFFIESQKVEELTKKNGYLFFSTNNLPTLWPRYSRFRTDLEIPIEEDYTHELINWEFLARFHHPTRTILVCDRYMFKDLRRVRDNLIPLLNKLTRFQPAHYKIDVILIGLFRDEYKGTLFPLSDINQAIEDSFSDGNCVRLTLVDTGKSFHSRRIVTSYWFINPDTSLDFINNNRLSRSSDGIIRHGFFYREPTINSVQSFLEKLHKIFSNGSAYVFDPTVMRDKPLPRSNDLLTAVQK